MSSTAVSPTGSASVSARRKFSGIVRDASDGIIKIFADATTKPTSTVNFSEGGLVFADFKAKNKISEFSATASNNTDIGGINIAEGCAPSGINNAIRELMAQLKDQQAGTDGDGFVVGGAFTCSGAAVFSSTVALGSSATATTQSSGVGDLPRST